MMGEVPVRVNPPRLRLQHFHEARRARPIQQFERSPPRSKVPSLCYIPLMDGRPTWDEYFMTITREVAERSTCLRAKVGAVIVRERNILATGYNGAPAGMPHCLDVGCEIYESRNPGGEIVQNCFRTIHAEINAIAQAARQGTAIREADIYVTHTPCVHCFKTIVNTGIRRVFYEKPYKVETIAELRERAGVELVQVAIPARS
jgi:dCMP deaminase